jgi:glycogen debranching enzyme
MMNFADALDDTPTKKQCGEWSRKVKANFTSLFWNEEASCLFDCISDGGKDGAIRPNQIFAVSLPHRLLTSELEKRVVATVQRELLTPFGLRSLSPRDAQYRGIYIGDQWQRDGSYHQGTVWGWLMGPFLSAYLKVNRNSVRAKTQVRDWMEPLQGHLETAGLGSVSEIFDGDAPHTPRGCFAQAWSVAEPLRVLLDEL